MSRPTFDLLGPEGFGVYEVDWDDGPSFRRVSRPPQGMLVPGFIDLHVHGAFGIDFMSATKEDMHVLCNRLEGEGYEGFLATTITASADDVKAAISRVPEHDAVLGFHLEGPFISSIYPGAQPAEFIVDPPLGPSEWDEVLEDPRLRLVTLAPERPGALELIPRLAARGVIVSMGHTNATYDEARRGFEFGALHATHTFNAMRPLHHREPGTVGYVLGNDTIMCELIYDRQHVVKDAAHLLLKWKTDSGVIAVSDGTMASGVPSGTTIDMWGTRCVVGRGDVRTEGGALAGSSITLYDAFKNLHDDFGPETAIRLCCLNPRRALRLAGPPRVWLQLDKKLDIVAKKVLAY